jgi:hypothetical protein
MSGTATSTVSGKQRRHPPKFAVGDRVMVEGDSVAPELRGQRGMVVRVSTKGGCSYWFRVLLENGRDLYFAARQLAGV